MAAPSRTLAAWTRNRWASPSDPSFLLVNVSIHSKSLKASRCELSLPTPPPLFPLPFAPFRSLYSLSSLSQYFLDSVYVPPSSPSHLCSDAQPARSPQRVLPDGDLLCSVQSSVYESLTAADRLQHVACVYLRYSSLLPVGGECHGIHICCELACKLLRRDGEFLTSHGRRCPESPDGRERFRKKIHTYIGWCDRLRAAASLHPEGCSDRILRLRSSLGKH